MTNNDIELPDSVGELDGYIHTMLEQRPPKSRKKEYMQWVWQINEAMTKCNAMTSKQMGGRTRWQTIAL